MVALRHLSLPLVGRLTAAAAGKMSPRGLRWLAAVAVTLVSLPGAQALDGGDAVALLLGLAISTVGLCACLGWYSRRRQQL